MTRRAAVLAATRRRARGDGGSVAIELVGYVAVLVVVACLCVQGLYISQVGAATQQAARDGARAHSLGRDVDLAVRRQLPGWATVDDISTSAAGGASTVQVTVRVPLVLPGITSRSFVVTRDAVLPRS